jgi:ectoine hydroxylase-related dioxygenase (phytanoyl-CoA dioxygenase family)
MERKPDPTEGDRDLNFYPVDTGGAETLSVEQLKHFNEAGYISPIDVFSSAEADDIRSYIDDLLDRVLSAPDRRNSYSINTYHLVCRKLYDLAVEPRILACVKNILGEEFVLWGQHLFAKMPGDGKVVPVHQDAVYWPLTPSRSVTVWLAIDDADAGNAAMQFVPGSHRNGALEHEELGLDGTRVLGRQVANPQAFSERFLNVLNAGQVSMHSDLLLHGSDANHSTRRRAGLTLRYTAADVRLIEGYEYWKKSAVHCLKGDPSGFWFNRRRPDGEHPEKMAEVYGEFDGQRLDAS